MFHVKQLLFAQIAEPITWLVMAVCCVKRSKQTGCVAIKVRSREVSPLWRAAAVIACKKRRKKEPEGQKLHKEAGYGAMIKVCKIGRKGCFVLKCRKSSGFFALDAEIDRHKRGCVSDRVEKTAKTCGFFARNVGGSAPAYRRVEKWIRRAIINERL